MLKLLLAKKHLLAWSKKYLEPAVSDHLNLLSCYEDKARFKELSYEAISCFQEKSVFMEIQLGIEIQLSSSGCGAAFLLLLILHIINKCVAPGVEIT